MRNKIFGGRHHLGAEPSCFIGSPPIQRVLPLIKAVRLEPRCLALSCLGPACTTSSRSRPRPNNSFKPNPLRGSPLKPYGSGGSA